jgi:hypothetical protein
MYGRKLFVEILGWSSRLCVEEEVLLRRGDKFVLTKPNSLGL